MSGSIDTSLANYGLVGSVALQSTKVSQNLDTLTEQISSGLIANTFAGLGSGASLTLDLSPQVAALQTYQTTIGAATGQMGVMQTAMGQIQQIAANLVQQLPSLNALNQSNVDTVAANARDSLKQVADLLNTQNGGVYIFSGEDSANPPVASGDNILTSDFFGQISASISQLTTNGSAATAAQILGIASSNVSGTTPFSSYLSQPGATAQSVATGGTTQLSYGILANANSAVASAGTATTGSYVRDLMMVLASVGSLSNAQVNDPNFSPLIQNLTTTLNGAVTAMNGDIGVMGDRQATLTTLSTTMATTSTALTGQISNVQDVDMSAAMSKLASVQTQLQASYKLIDMVNSLSLVNFLPNG